MLRHVPNALTTCRLVLAVVFFWYLELYQYEGRGDPTFLNIAFVIYLVALVTDFLDGYLARRWKIESAFGRIVDPFVDKVLVLGSFIFFAGKNFVIPETLHSTGSGAVGIQITGVAPAMVVVILARELLVTSLRGASESGGKDFGAAFSGKFKMAAQSVTILVILVYVNYLDFWSRTDARKAWATGVRDACIWLTIAITVFSGLLYIQRAMALFREGTKDEG